MTYRNETKQKIFKGVSNPTPTLRQEIIKIAQLGILDTPPDKMTDAILQAFLKHLPKKQDPSNQDPDGMRFS